MPGGVCARRDDQVPLKGYLRVQPRRYCISWRSHQKHESAFQHSRDYSVQREAANQRVCRGWTRTSTGEAYTHVRIKWHLRPPKTCYSWLLDACLFLGAGLCWPHRSHSNILRAKMHHTASTAPFSEPKRTHSKHSNRF